MPSGEICYSWLVENRLYLETVFWKGQRKKNTPRGEDSSGSLLNRKFDFSIMKLGNSCVQLMGPSIRRLPVDDGVSINNHLYGDPLYSRSRDSFFLLLSIPSYLVSVCFLFQIFFLFTHLKTRERESLCSTSLSKFVSY